MKLFDQNSVSATNQHSISLGTNMEPDPQRGLGRRDRRLRPLQFALLGLLVFGFCLAGLRFFNHAHAANPTGFVFASSANDPQLQLPEGLTSWHNKIYVGDYDIAHPENSQILVYNASNGKLIRTITGISTKKKGGGSPLGPLLGLTIDRKTGDLYVAANGLGQVLQVKNPESNNPRINVYSTLPAVGSTPAGPEDMAFNNNGTLYISDSNTQRIYSIPPGGGQPTLLEGPQGSGAPLIDNGDLSSPVDQGSPNGLVFNLSYSTLYANNLGTDSVVAFDVTAQGQLTNERILAQHINDDLEEYPTGDEILIQPDTHYGASATTPLNGADGLALDSQGDVWVASALGDNLTEINPNTGAVITTVGTSAVTQQGLLNNPASLTFVGNTIYTTNLNFFAPNLPFTVAAFDVGVSGAGGNGNY
jgi:sugar lactone lactonase YvrE